MISFLDLFFHQRRSIPALALSVLLLSLSTDAHGQGFTLTFTTSPELTNASSASSIWLNVLNTSDREMTWTFPQKIETRAVAAQNVFSNSLVLLTVETNPVVIAPGTFVRREYMLPVPASVTGQMVVEFPSLNAGRVVLNVASALPLAATPAPGAGSVFNKYVADAESGGTNSNFYPGQFFKEHISGYEPLYFIAGSKSPNAKFQISFKYQLLNNDGPLAESVPMLRGFHIAYTQTSLWNLSGGDPSFYDTNYKPEFLYLWDRVVGGQPTNWYRLDLQTGLQHDSNGTGGTNERSLNMAYLRPTFTLGRDDGLQLVVQPKAWVYLGNLDHNPDMPDYLGYVSLRTVLGWKRGLQLSALGQLGKDGEHGGLQLDLTYPTMRFFGSFSLYLDVQYFTGYGESLLTYNQRTDQFRVGLALFR